MKVFQLLMIYSNYL